MVFRIIRCKLHKILNYLSGGFILTVNIIHKSFNIIKAQVNFLQSSTLIGLFFGVGFGQNSNSRNIAIPASGLSVPLLELLGSLSHHIVPLLRVLLYLLPYIIHIEPERLREEDHCRIKFTVLSEVSHCVIQKFACGIAQLHRIAARVEEPIGSEPFALLEFFGVIIKEIHEASVVPGIAHEYGMIPFEYVAERLPPLVGKLIDGLPIILGVHQQIVMYLDYRGTLSRRGYVVRYRLMPYDEGELVLIVIYSILYEMIEIGGYDNIVLRLAHYMRKRDIAHRGAFIHHHLLKEFVALARLLVSFLIIVAVIAVLVLLGDALVGFPPIKLIITAAFRYLLFPSVYKLLPGWYPRRYGRSRAYNKAKALVAVGSLRHIYIIHKRTYPDYLIIIFSFSSFHCRLPQYKDSLILYIISHALSSPE